jgi:hypothetical protein
MQQENRENSTGIQAEAKDYSTVYAAKVINQYNTYEVSRTPGEIPFQALSLPKDYVDRPAIRQEVKSKLLDTAPSRPGTLVVSAIYGLAGVGKSVLASALAHDAEVQSFCMDGVLWTTLGQNPDVLSTLYGWIQALDDRDYRPTTIDSASAHLRTLLHDKKMLLVVDDAWHTEHVEAFKVGGEGCRVLVTTREAYVPDTERINMDAMSQDEALELLLSKAQRNTLTALEEEQARRLVEVVGCLPLAVELAGAQIADGVQWQELLEDLGAEIAYLETLDRPNLEGVRDEKTRKRLSLKASLNLSLKLLTEEQLWHFAWLGVLPEDVSIQPEMATMLWSVGRRQAGAILRNFRAKALLSSGVQESGQDSTYRLHDLMHDLARGLLTGIGEKDIPGLNLDLKGAHAELLDRYRLTTTAGQWHCLEDDGYIHAHLSWHFEQAGQADELHRLLQEETSEERNGWYEACEKLGRTANFVTDMARAWRLAEVTIETDKPRMIALQMRYALIFTTLNSLASNIPAELMAALIENGLWTPAQGLAYSQQVQDDYKQIEVIRSLIPYCNHSLQLEILEIVRSIRNEHVRASALRSLVPYLLDNLRSEVLEVAYSIQDVSKRVSVFRKLMPHLPEIATETLRLARSIQDKSDRANALSDLAFYFPEILLEVLQTVHLVQDEYSRAYILKELVPRLPQKLLPKALEVVCSIQNESYQAEAFSALLPYLPEIAAETLKVVRSIQDDFEKAYALGRLLPHLPEVAMEALEVTYAIEDEFKQCDVFTVLMPHLPKDLFLELLETILSFQSECSQALALSTLTSHLPENLLPKTLNVARSMQDEFSRARVLSALTPYFPEINTEALEATRSIQDKSDQVFILSELVSQLPKDLLPEVLEVSLSIQDKSEQMNTLFSLITYLPEEILPEALRVARSLQDKPKQVLVLSRLIPPLPAIASDSLEVVRLIQDEFERAHALSDLIPHLPENLLSKVLEIARSIQNEYSQLDVLIDLAANLSNRLNLIPETLEIIYSMQDEFCKGYALSSLVPYLPEIAVETLEIVHSLEREFDKSDILSNLAPHIPESLLSGTLEIVDSIQSESDRINAFASFVPRLDIADRWSEILHTLARRDRKDFLGDVPTLVPAIIQLGGHLALKLTVQAIQDVCKQWP